MQVSQKAQEMIKIHAKNLGFRFEYSKGQNPVSILWGGIINLPYSVHGLPVGVLGVASSLASDGVFEYLSAVDFLLHGSTSYEAIDDNVFILTNPEHPVHCLGISGRIPAGII